LMEDRQFGDAYKKLFEAFEYYVEIGSEIRIPCLKYMLMANMLTPVVDGTNKINPFTDKAAAPLQQHKSIKPLSDLLDAYEKKRYQRI